MTHGGLEPLQERMCVRPTCRHFSVIFMQRIFSLTEICRRCITSGALLCAGEERISFYVQENFYGRKATQHTLQPRRQRKERADASLLCEASARRCLQSPDSRDVRRDWEKFAGAEATYTIEALMHDGKR